MGKVVGGGLPVGAFGGRADVLDHIAPTGPVYQAGTLSGNPLATAAGLATLAQLGDASVYEELERKGARLHAGLEAAITDAGVTALVQRVGSMMTLFFNESKVTSLDSLENVDTDRYAKFFHGMLEAGVSLPPSQYEAFFVSTVHTDEDIDAVAAAAKSVLASLA